ncbi:lactonase family protein [Kaistia sp. MMO-174]|uniref:lactonase family protein n=1 Tax=Kaistia sp. MMO-174 TaxID=3081256 RepID=UPI003018E072
MSDVQHATGEALYIASRGVFELHGLTRWALKDGAWKGETLGRAEHLSALAWHPTLPMIYGTSRVGMDGSIHAWRIDGDKAETIGDKASGGAEPCHLTVDPSGRLLVFTNYTTSTLGLQRLAADGSFDGEVALVKLSGGGPELDRQDDAHPHQAFFVGETLFVIDLGDDSVREFSVDLAKPGAEALKQTRVTRLPAGCGPRHAVVLNDGRLAISGELGSNLLVGHPGAPEGAWQSVPSTTRPGPARTRHRRNYPGDIQRSADGRFVYFANRGNDTISTFDVTGLKPRLVSEIDSTVFWPQHLLVQGDRLLVAGWDSSRIAVLTLRDGVPVSAATAFECAFPGWILPQQRA